MAITDYSEINFTIYHVTETSISDGTGSYEQTYVIGNSFAGSCVKSPTSEQIVAGIRDDKEDQYSLTVPKSEPIVRNEILMFYKKDGTQQFVRVNSEPLYTPEISSQCGWKGFTASEYRPREISDAPSETEELSEVEE